jgi:hypothetical protein
LPVCHRAEKWQILAFFASLKTWTLLWKIRLCHLDLQTLYRKSSVSVINKWRLKFFLGNNCIFYRMKFWGHRVTQCPVPTPQLCLALVAEQVLARPWRQPGLEHDS